MTVQAVLTRRPVRRRILPGGAHRRAWMLLSGVMLLGVLSGVVLFLFFRTAFQTALWDCFSAFCTAAQNGGFLEALSGFALQALLLWSALSLLGTTPVGVWLLHPLVFLKCAGLGALTAFFLQSFGIDGAGFYFLSVFPGKLFFCAGLLVLYGAALGACLRVKGALKGEGALPPDAHRRYAAKIAVSGLLLLFGAVIDGLTATLFSGVFQLSLPGR